MDSSRFSVYMIFMAEFSFQHIDLVLIMVLTSAKKDFVFQGFMWIYFEKKNTWKDFRLIITLHLRQTWIELARTILQHLSFHTGHSYMAEQ